MRLLSLLLSVSRSVGFVLALVLGSAQVFAAVAVEGLRLWHGDDRTRLVFDLDAPVRHQLSTMSGPHRLVIDLEQGRLATALHEVGLEGTQIRSIRSGRYGNGQLRIVLDLYGEVRVSSFALAPSSSLGHRLVIDLVGGMPAPAAARTEPLTVAARSSSEAPADKRAVLPVPASVESAPVKATPKTEPRSSSRPPLSTPQPRQPLQGRSILIAVDAGHGGQDPGAIGPGRVREKDVVLAIARELQKRIDAQPGYRAMLTRSSDRFIALHQRRDLARAQGADLFVSIHADAFTHQRARGASVYALSQRGATSVSAAFLAQRENGADLIDGVDLGAKDPVVAGVLTDLSMTAMLDASLGAGSRVLDSVGRIAHLHNTRVEQAGFVVLKSPDMPSILVETGFISNPLEAQRLGNPSYQRNMAAAIFTGLADYFLMNPPPGTQIALSVRAGARPSQYTITRGDTLSGIAERYRVSVADIVRTNGLGGGNDIRAGQTIVIPQI